jgi:hypothetical protein
VIIAIFAYIWLIIFENGIHPVIIYLSIAPLPLFWFAGKNKQKSILKLKQVTTRLFDNFIKFMLP